MCGSVLSTVTARATTCPPDLVQGIVLRAAERVSATNAEDDDVTIVTGLPTVGFGGEATPTDTEGHRVYEVLLPLVPNDRPNVVYGLTRGASPVRGPIELISSNALVESVLLYAGTPSLQFKVRGVVRRVEFTSAFPVPALDDPLFGLYAIGDRVVKDGFDRHAELIVNSRAPLSNDPNFSALDRPLAIAMAVRGSGGPGLDFTPPTGLGGFYIGFDQMVIPMAPDGLPLTPFERLPIELGARAREAVTVANGSGHQKQTFACGGQAIQLTLNHASEHIHEPILTYAVVPLLLARQIALDQVQMQIASTTLLNGRRFIYPLPLMSGPIEHQRGVIRRPYVLDGTTARDLARALEILTLGVFARDNPAQLRVRIARRQGIMNWMENRTENSSLRSDTEAWARSVLRKFRIAPNDGLAVREAFEFLDAIRVTAVLAHPYIRALRRANGLAVVQNRDAFGHPMDVELDIGNGVNGFVELDADGKLIFRPFDP